VTESPSVEERAVALRSVHGVSVYALDEICYRLGHEPEFRASVVADACAAIVDADLTDAERAAFLTGDVATLYRMGVHAFLLGHLVRYGVAGLDAATYSERIHLIG
jgi:hypothetical protein